MSTTAFKEKPLIRREVLSSRDSIDRELRRTKDTSIRKQLLALPEYMTAHTILFYASFRSEVDTIELLKKSLLDKKTVVLPKVNLRNDWLDLYEIHSMKDLASGYLGIPEPGANEDRKKNTVGIDLMIIPGVAFDLRCNRLGYGKGFYDKLLSGKSAHIIALAYEEQILAEIPTDAHDIQMHKIITDKRIIQLNGR